MLLAKCQKSRVKATHVQCVSRLWTNLTCLSLVMVILSLSYIIYDTAPAASKNDARFKSSQK